MISRTSASLVVGAGADRAERRGPSAAAASASMVSRAARAAERALSGRRAPGIATIAGESADRGAPRRPWIGGVDQVEVDWQAAQRGQAGLAVAEDPLGPSIGHPAAGRTRHPALGHDARAGGDAGTGQRAGQEPLVLP